MNHHKESSSGFIPMKEARRETLPPPAVYKAISRRRGCSPCTFICWLLGLVVTFILVVVAVFVILYLVLKPKVPTFEAENVKINSNVLANTAVIDFNFETHNPNKVSIYYYNSTAGVEYNNTSLGNAQIPAFKQPKHSSRNITATLSFSTDSASPAVQALLSATKSTVSEVVLQLDINVRAKAKIWILWTPKLKVGRKCNITISTSSGNLTKKSCSKTTFRL